MQTEHETTPQCAAIEPAARGVRVINTPDCAALKGAMSVLGKHRRMTANRAARNAAKEEEGK